MKKENKGNHGKKVNGRKANIDMKSLNEASLAFDALINRAVKK